MPSGDYVYCPVCRTNSMIYGNAACSECLARMGRPQDTYGNQPTYGTQPPTDDLKQSRYLYGKEWRRKNVEYVRQRKREYYKNLKLDGIKHYGGKCTCCGEDIIEFLTLEHLNGRQKTSKRKKTGVKAWEEAKSMGWPDTITVLCFNCNCAKGAFGICPHQTHKH